MAKWMGFEPMRLIVGLFLLVLSNAAQAQADEPVLFVDNPALLAQMETKGYGFSTLFGPDAPDDLGSLYEKAPAYRAMIDMIGTDIGAVRAEMEAGGRPLYELTNAKAGRVLDMRWLKNAASRMRLVGIVNRIDRRDFAAAKGQGGCGEVRLIYRLAYRFKKGSRTLSSRMPFNFNAVFDVDPDADGGCMGVAGRWTPQIDENVDAGWLAGGPLDRTALTFRQLELNTQIVRFPSEMEPGFGGQATYLMRIFGIEGDNIVELPLENTPDAARLAEDAALKAALAGYVREHVADVDMGVYQIPDRFLARKIVSFSTFGSGREANHPFTAAFAASDFAGLDYSALGLVRSPAALIARLDNGSCQGCHQSGSTAGFHFIGLDNDETSPLNRIEVGISPHFHAEIPRRTAYIKTLALDETPNRFRPLSSAPPASWDSETPDYADAEITMPCMMPEDAQQFGAAWQCGAGTVCTPLGVASGPGLKVAQCLLPKDSEAMFSGHPCLSGDIAGNDSEPFNDTLTVTSQFAAFEEKVSRSAYSCRPPRIGVPGGIAYRNCNDRDRSFAGFKRGGAMPNEICALVGGKKFDLCVATNNFDQCLGGAVNRGNRQACSANHFCREDYMCQTLPADTPGAAKVKGIGFCSPTYFIFQMRIDNHATPWAVETARMFGEDEPAYRSVEADAFEAE
jgi:hypothetical protein